MAHIYNITDSSDGSLLVTIATSVKCKTILAKTKKDTDTLWYKNQDETELLTPTEIGIITETVNADWVEIFEVMLKDKIDYTVMTVEEV